MTFFFSFSCLQRQYWILQGQTDNGQWIMIQNIKILIKTSYVYRMTVTLDTVTPSTNQNKPNTLLIFCCIYSTAPHKNTFFFNGLNWCDSFFSLLHLSVQHCTTIALHRDFLIYLLSCAHFSPPLGNLCLSCRVQCSRFCPASGFALFQDPRGLQLQFYTI